MASGTSRPSVTARVLGILEAFTPSSPALSLSDISRRTGLPPATAHRLVGELTRWGALERDEQGIYRIGLRLWEVAALAPRGLGLREIAMPFLEDLYEATHQNVQLAVLDGLEVLYLERIAGRDAVHVFTRVGGRFPAHATGVGLAILAHSDPEVQERAIEGPLPRFTEKTISTGAELRRALAEVRRTGLAVSDGQVELIALSVAAPIFGRDDRVEAAVSIVVPSEGYDWRVLAPAVRAAARGISRALGSPRAARQPVSAVHGHRLEARSSGPVTRPASGPSRRGFPLDGSPIA
ncbi:IclR family transcriptional regulator [Actinomadura sp. NBRC 104412]|uniref:IclR family transcriptional regulator n=1 Tax=Actinomadura sp. NBRC 104412 TaxID=3032203 RepID=UPI0024A0404D|nr:IclR family transcriptional regulator [Actinomadura sp. NBRC 104412]GLZ03198.1 IclR family transcriptional regulator [Actinomadura sp. NBRC 104412]